MNQKQFQDEITYQLSLLQARHLVDKGIISEDEFDTFQQQMLEKYSPLISQLAG